MDPLILIIEELHRARTDVEKYETDLTELEKSPTFNPKSSRYNRLLWEKDLVLKNLCDLRSDLSKKAVDLKGNAIYAREEDGATRYFLDKVPSASSLEVKPKPEPAAEAPPSFSTQDTVTQSYTMPTQSPPLAPVRAQVSGARRAHAHTMSVPLHANVEQGNNYNIELHSGTPATQGFQTHSSSYQSYPVQVVPQAHAHLHQQPHLQQYQQPQLQHTQPQQHMQSPHLSAHAHAHTVVSNPNHGSYVIASPAGFSGPPTQRRPDPTDLPDLPKYLAAKADLSAIMRDFTDNKIHFVGVDNHVIAMAEYQNISKFTKSGEDPAKFMKGEYRSYKTGYVKKTNSYTENKLFFPVFHPYAPQHISGL